MGSVPNYRKEIANHYGIRWFKCKLKPPKNIYLDYVDVVHVNFICIDLYIPCVDLICTDLVNRNSSLYRSTLFISGLLMSWCQIFQIRSSSRQAAGGSPSNLHSHFDVNYSQFN